MKRLVSIPFNQLGNIVGLISGEIRTTTHSGLFNGIEYDNLELQECAYDYEPNHLYGLGISATAPVTGSETLGFTMRSSNAFLLSDFAPILAGWKDIDIGDSMEAVLSKLGLDPTLSKYPRIYLHIAQDSTVSSAWVDSETWGSLETLQSLVYPYDLS